MSIVVIAKSIKPKRLKDEDMKRILRNAMRRMAYAVKKDFEATVKTWDHKPTFTVLTSLRGNESPSILVGTDDLIYLFVDKGTKRHPIFPKNYPYLKFQEGYNAKTTPNVIGSGAGGPYGKWVLSFFGVEHPGTKPRNFEKMIAKKWTPKFKAEMHQAMKEAREASGHKI